MYGRVRQKQEKDVTVICILIKNGKCCFIKNERQNPVKTRSCLSFCCWPSAEAAGSMSCKEILFCLPVKHSFRPSCCAADVSGMVEIVENDSEDALRVAVERSVYNFVIRNESWNCCKLFFAAFVVPFGKSRDLLFLDEAHHVLCPCGSLCCVQCFDRENTAS